MPSAFFLAQTGAQFHLPPPFGAKKAWMACHFSSYGTGLSNLPQQLPPESMVILNDRIPIFGHDGERIAGELGRLVEAHRVSHVFLDFQRPWNEETAEVAKAIEAALPCPVGITEVYAKDVPCALCLGPVPPHLSIEEWVGPWADRRIWLELAPVCRAYTIREDGCACQDAPPCGEFPHFDELANCRYRIETAENAIRFTLTRGQAELERMRNMDGIEVFVGLYQEFAHPEAQATALAQ